MASIDSDANPDGSQRGESRAVEGSVVVITGGAQGLGLAYARRLAEAGARVAIVDVAQAAVAEIRQADDAAPQLAAFVADVTRRDEVARVVEDITTSVGEIDVLINNAGGALLPRADFDQFSEEEWHRVIDVNLTAQWLMAQAVVPTMRRRRSGKIINVTSVIVHRAEPLGLVPYATAKAGVIGLTRALARELGPDGITVNAIAPGYTPVQTVKQVHGADQTAQLAEWVLEHQSLKRIETPDDLAKVVEFLVSPASDFITGQVINVDGGSEFR